MITAVNTLFWSYSSSMMFSQNGSIQFNSRSGTPFCGHCTAGQVATDKPADHMLSFGVATSNLCSTPASMASPADGGYIDVDCAESVKGVVVLTTCSNGSCGSVG